MTGCVVVIVDAVRMTCSYVNFFVTVIQLIGGNVIGAPITGSVTLSLVCGAIDRKGRNERIKI